MFDLLGSVFIPVSLEFGREKGYMDIWMMVEVSVVHKEVLLSIWTSVFEKLGFKPERFGYSWQFPVSAGCVLSLPVELLQVCSRAVNQALFVQPVKLSLHAHGDG